MRCTAFEAVLAPRDRFLALLAEGWRFPDDVADEAVGHHGYWSVCLVRSKESAARAVKASLPQPQ